MTDTATAFGPPQPPLGKTWRVAVTMILLATCIASITYLEVAGEPGNELHRSALSWCFTMIAGIMVGVGVGTITSYIPALLGRPTTTTTGS